MSSPTLRNIIIVVFIITLIPLVIIPFYNKQRELSSDISQYEEILSVINTEIDDDSDITSVLGTYDVVKDLDLSEYKRVKADVNLPTISLSKNKTYNYDVGNSEIEVVYERPKEYDENLDDVFMYTNLLFKDSKLCNIQIRGSNSSQGRLSIHIFDDKKLKYAALIVGEQRAAAFKDQKSVYFLIEDELVRYRIKSEDSINDTILSMLDVDLYLKDDIEYVFTYWEDSTVNGKRITLWSIDHINRLLVREKSVLEI
jgi:hypothetical protein